MEDEETTMRQGKGKRKSEVADVDAQFDQLIALAAELKSIEARALEKLQRWRAASGFDEMEAAMQEWRSCTQQKEKLVVEQLRPLARAIVAYYKAYDHEEDKEDDDEGEGEGEGEGKRGRLSTEDLDDLSTTLHHALSIADKVKREGGGCHSSPVKRRRNMDE